MPCRASVGTVKERNAPDGPQRAAHVLAAPPLAGARVINTMREAAKYLHEHMEFPEDDEVLSASGDARLLVAVVTPDGHMAWCVSSLSGKATSLDASDFVRRYTHPATATVLQRIKRNTLPHGLPS